MKAEEIFLAAVEKSSPTDRAAYLDRACGDDVGLRDWVEGLLRSHEQGGSFLEGPLFEPRLTIDHVSPTEGPGSRIGPYRLIEQIGEGGMGAVFMAEQEHPVRRKVALKIIKPGMDSAQVVARFEAERQALAMMDHPNIARVLDAGVTDSGRPFFVMELVKGVPITEYCDANHLTPRQRLELFVPVCAAIQHAHQKGIIHRDVKPSNVLVTLYDGKPVPKVIDFGVAKATDQRLTQRTLFTRFGDVVGTLEYMSPEQASPNALDVDTRSDVYSLGVLLYELLTGTTPLERERLRAAGYDEILRRIKEEEPPKPSTRLSSSGDRLASIAATRGTEPARLSRQVRGDLDWIVIMALEKDRTRRYETANEFARDVERYLEGDPVEAGPPSVSYRLRKLARKHRAALATAVALALLLVVAAAVSTWQAVRATRAERDALDAARRAVVAEELARNRLGEVEHANTATTKALAEMTRAQKATEMALTQSEEARKQAEAVRTFLVDAFRGLDPHVTGHDVKAVDVLDRASEKLDKEFAGSPVTRGALLNALGQTYSGLGLYDKAEKIHTKALAARESALGPDHTESVSSRRNLAEVYFETGRVAEASALLEESLKLREAKLGPDHPDTLQSRYSLAMAYAYAHRPAEAIALLERTLKQSEAKLGPDHADTLKYRNGLAVAYAYAHRPAEAIALHEGTLKLRDAKLGPDHPDTLESLHNLAAVHISAGRPAEAIAANEETLRRIGAKLGPDDPDTLPTRFNLALAYTRAGRTADAITMLEGVLKQAKTMFGRDHPETLECLSALAGAHESADRWADTEPLRREVLSRRRKTVKPDSPLLGYDLALLGQNLLKQAKWSEAEPMLRECLAIRKGKRPDDWSRFYTMSLLGGALLGQGRYAEAQPLVVSGYEGMKARVAKTSPLLKHLISEAAERVVRLYEAWGKPEQAATWRARLGLADLPDDVFAPP